MCRSFRPHFSGCSWTSDFCFISPPSNFRKEWPAQQEALLIENTVTTEAVHNAGATSSVLHPECETLPTLPFAVKIVLSTAPHAKWTCVILYTGLTSSRMVLTASLPQSRQFLCIFFIFFSMKIRIKETQPSWYCSREIS